MKKLSVLTAIAVLALVIGLAGSQFLRPASAITSPGEDISDHALFDETSGDTGCTCSSNKSFTFYLSCQASVGGGDAKVRVDFVPDPDPQVVFFPIPNGQSFSLVQSAGGTPGSDDVLVVTNSFGGNNLVYWCSITTQRGALPLAATAPDYCTTQ